MELSIVEPSESIDFRMNKRLLNRYRYIEHEMVRALAGWLPAVAHMETKLDMGRLLWEDAQHVQQLYLRLREVQNPAFRPPDDPALERLMREAIHAPSAEDLLAGLFRVIKPALVAAYEWHCEQTFANRTRRRATTCNISYLTSVHNWLGGNSPRLPPAGRLGSIHRGAAGSGGRRDWAKRVRQRRMRQHAVGHSRRCARLRATHASAWI